MGKATTVTTRSLWAGVALALLAGCSGKTEDVRIKLCRNLTERLLESVSPITWKSQHAEIRQQGDAMVRLELGISKDGYENRVVVSACFFDPDQLEESVVEHVDPLSAFATIPYAMTVEGAPVPEQILHSLVHDAQWEPVADFFSRMEASADGGGSSTLPPAH